MPDNFNSDDRVVLTKFFEEVKKHFLDKGLNTQMQEFEKLFLKDKNYLAAHAYANEVAMSNDFVIDKKIDEEFWRTVW